MTGFLGIYISERSTQTSFLSAMKRKRDSEFAPNDDVLDLSCSARFNNCEPPNKRQKITPNNVRLEFHLSGLGSCCLTFLLAHPSAGVGQHSVPQYRQRPKGILVSLPLHTTQIDHRPSASH